MRHLRMGARTRRLIFIRLMAVCAICFMAIGHLLYSMTAGLDGYARLHMSVIAPSATSHKDLDNLMRRNADNRGAPSRDAGARAGGIVDMKHQEGKTIGKMDNFPAKCSGHGKSPRPAYCKNTSLGTKHGSHDKTAAGYLGYNIQDAPNSIFPQTRKEHSGRTFDHWKSKKNKSNSGLIRVEHCPRLQIDLSRLIGAIKVKSHSPWQPILPGNGSYIHSAYYDGRDSINRDEQTKQVISGKENGEPTAMFQKAHLGAPRRAAVVVIGIVQNIKAAQVPRFCQLWYPEQNKEGVEGNREGYGGSDEEEGTLDNGREGEKMRRMTIRQSPMAVRLRAQRLNDGSGGRFVAFLYTCSLPTKRQPLGVSLVEEACSSPTNYLSVVQQTHPKEKSQFSVCLPALKPDFQDIDALLQTVEINRMFGAERFTFYVHTAGIGVKKHVRKYVTDNIAHRVPYTFPIDEGQENSRQLRKMKNELHAALKMASINDCLYRNMYRTKYIIFAGPDEILVPRGFKNWATMLAEVTENIQRDSAASLQAAGRTVSGTHENKIPSAFSVKSVLFRTEWPDNPMYSKTPELYQYHLYSLLKTNREQIGLPGRNKPGFITNPSQVSGIGFGKMWGSDSKVIQEISVPESMGLVHIYSHSKVKSQEIRKKTSSSPQSATRTVAATMPMTRMINDHSLLAYYDVILARVMERHERVNDAIA